MKISAFSAFETEGGAARAAYRLHAGVRALGVDSQLYVKRRSTDEFSTHAPKAGKDKLVAAVSYRIDQAPLSIYPKRRLLPWSTGLWPTRCLDRSRDFDPDLVHLHWINNGFLGIGEIGRIEKPVVWTLHDMWPLTGGCHHSEGCAGFTLKCGACPQLGSGSSGDLSRRVMKKKLRSWTRMNTCWVTPSRWLAGKVGQSAIAANARVEVIPNGIDTGRFAPFDRALSRRLLGLPQGRLIVMFGAVSSTSNPWKGYQHLRNVLEVLADQGNDIDLAVFGASAPPGNAPGRLNVHYLGSFSDELAMAIAYAAADIFVAPSTEDNLPNTVMEAMSCGIPVVAFRIGGMPDMIVDGETGFLIDPFDITAFAAAIQAIARDPIRRQSMGSAARIQVERRFALPLVAARYRELYEEVIRAHR